jgi:hypothetical protein
MQMNLDLVLADHAQRAVSQSNLAALDLDSDRGESLGNVDGADRANRRPSLPA